jgi:hypothetical protein
MVDGECSAELLSLRLPPTLAWQTLTPSGDWPSCRLGHAACAVVDAHQLWVFGGGDGRVLLNDVWTLDRLPSSHAQHDAWSCSWQCQKCAGDAASRMGHNLVYMASQKALLSFGGFVKGVKGGYSAQVLRLDLGTLTWSEPMLAATPAAEPPLLSCDVTTSTARWRQMAARQRDRLRTPASRVCLWAAAGAAGIRGAARWCVV